MTNKTLRDLQIRGTGLILGIEFTDNKSPNDPFPPEWGKFNTHFYLSLCQIKILNMAILSFLDLNCNISSTHDLINGYPLIPLSNLPKIF